MHLWTASDKASKQCSPRHQGTCLCVDECDLGTRDLINEWAESTEQPAKDGWGIDEVAAMQALLHSMPCSHVTSGSDDREVLTCRLRNVALQREACAIASTATSSASGAQ